MNRQPVFTAGILALVATASLVVAAKAPRFTPVTDETLRSPAPADWPAWRRDRAGTGYSPLDQINRSTVRRLHLAWASTLEAGSLEPEPLVFNGVMYVPHPGDIVQALDARNGTLLWEYRRERSKDARGGGLGVSRNLALYQDKVFVGTSDAHLVALDARTGKVAWDVAVSRSCRSRKARPASTGTAWSRCRDRTAMSGGLPPFGPQRARCCGPTISAFRSDRC
jgi:alcohol dehydrogenase (cytochrome c)